ncbi:MAG: hypothetical protein IT458_13185 [Planctomycetes bacterium]|nr:hypothetical protein [Planctomycetota bacterium]
MHTLKDWSRKAPLIGALAMGLGSQVPAPGNGGAAHELRPEPARIPIRDEGVDPLHGSLGVWGAGRAYKCGFDGGFTMVPYLGREAPRNLPWRWITTSARIGAEDLHGGGAAQTAFTEYRHESRRGLVTEVYDVHVEGVKQSFVVHARPEAGALVIRGRIETGLRAAPGPAGVRSFHFADPDGRAAITYGEAVAIDARGERFPVTSAFDGDEIELAITAEDVARATFPLTVDPWITPVVLGSGSYGLLLSPPQDLEIERVPTTLPYKLLYAYARYASLGDADLYVLRCDEAFGGVIATYSELSTTVATKEPSLGSAAHDGHYLVAFTRAAGSNSTVHVYRKSGDDLTSGAPVVNLGVPAGFTERTPRLGGRRVAATGTQHALLVRLREPAAGGLTEVHASILYGSPMVSGPSFHVGGGGALLQIDTDRPWVTRDTTGPYDPWLVAFQEWGAGSDRWNVRVVRVEYTGQLAAQSFVPSLGAYPAHQMAPRIEGAGGRYLLTFATAPTLTYPGKLATHHGQEILALRVDWGLGQPPRTPHVRTNLWGSTSRDLVQGGLAFDIVSRSHWAAAATKLTGNGMVWKLGYAGGAISSDALPVPATGSVVARMPALTFDQERERFALLWRRDVTVSGATGWELLGALNEYPAQDDPVLYGVKCGGYGTISAYGSWRRGSGTAILGAGSLPANQAVVGLLSLGSADLPLANFGLPGGCSIRVDLDPPRFLVALSLVAGGTGVVNLPLILQESVAAADLHAQFFYFGSTPGTLAATQGLKIEIR